MPNQTVSFKRRTVIICFIILTLAFVAMGIILGIQIGKNQNNIELIQEASITACKKISTGVQGLFILSINDLKKSQNGNLTKEQQDTIDKYMTKLDPKQCEKELPPVSES